MKPWVLPLLLCCWLALPSKVEAAPTTSLEDGEAEVPTEDTPADPAVEEAEPEPPQVDPLTAHLQQLVQRYYEGIEATASDDENARGVESVQMMVLSGISLEDIERAIEAAIRLHTPGRRIPFEIAVPLRVKSAPDVAGEVEEEETTRHRVTLPPPTAIDPEQDERRRAAHAAEEVRRARYGLYRQWRERTRTKRTLMSVGVPLLVTAYVTGFGTAGIALFSGAPITHGQAWLAAIPIVGTAILTGVSDGILTGFPVLTIIQGVGLALIIAGAVLPVDYPYERDPTALRLGRTKDGRHALELGFRPGPTGGTIVGIF